MPDTTTRPAQHDYAPFYAGYIARVPDGDILDTLRSQQAEMQSLLSGLNDEQALYRYASGKWSIKELVGHLLDAERIFACRALRFARNDATPLPGFEEDDYVRNGGFDNRTVESLAREYGHVRHATLDLFSFLPAEAWERRGPANGVEVSVRALAWITAGHERHHLMVLRERYLELA